MPDQWLEVMVSGGFKVWHIIFIIIALIVTMVVVYCCFHRCRIPRTKQEIEADLMRSNMTNKFRDYLQELPNEPVTFIEVLKKVQDMEEKLEKDNAQVSRDAGMRKRMGWLNLKGKNSSPQNADLETGQGEDQNTVAPATTTTTPSEPTTNNLFAKQPTLTKEFTLPDTEAKNLLTDLLSTERKDDQNNQAKKILTNISKSSLDVNAAAKLAKDQHRAKQHELRNKRSPPTPNNKDQQTSPTATIATPNNLLDDKHVVRRRKQDKPNLSRSKMVREKTHSSIDANGVSANGHSDEKHKPAMTSPTPAAHGQAHITFEEPVVDKEMPKEKKKAKKKQSPEKKLTKAKKVKRPRDKNL